MLGISVLFPGNITSVKCELSGNDPTVDGVGVLNTEEVLVNLAELTS